MDFKGLVGSLVLSPLSLWISGNTPNKVQQKSPNEMIHFLDELPRDWTALVWILNPLSKDGCDGVYIREL